MTTLETLAEFIEKNNLSWEGILIQDWKDGLILVTDFSKDF